MGRSVLALVAAGLLAGCQGGLASPPDAASTRQVTGAPDAGAMTPSPMTDNSPVPIPRTIGPADDGRAFRMAIGETAALIVPDPHAPDPTATGDSLEVVEMRNVTASGRREWELRGVAVGRTVLRAEGDHPFTIAVDVEEPSP